VLIFISNDRSEIYLTDEVLRSAHRLLAICIFSRNSKQVDLISAQNMGIPVFISPYQHQQSVGILFLI
jgi:phosphoglycerate dehydrogenase-like enzyme